MNVGSKYLRSNEMASFIKTDEKIYNCINKFIDNCKNLYLISCIHTCNSECIRVVYGNSRSI